MNTQANKLSRKDLYSLEDYAQMRDEFRTKIMAHKRNRRVDLGPNLTLLFEDKLIMQYQVQEMLKAERIFEAEGIEEELESYNPLIPDGSNWKATMMIQYTDVDERKDMLTKLTGIEDKTWMQVADYDKVFAIADEDMERTTDNKTSAVHFLRFELSAEMIAAVSQGAAIKAGVEHSHYSYIVDPLPQNVAASLADDLRIN